MEVKMNSNVQVKLDSLSRNVANRLSGVSLTREIKAESRSIGTSNERIYLKKIKQ